MAKISGKNLVVLWIHSGGTANLSDTIRNFEVPKTQESADATAGADEYRNFVKTVKTIEASGELVMKDHAGGGSALRAGVSEGKDGTLLWGIEGTAAGKPKAGFVAFITDASESIPYDDVVTLAVTWVLNGTGMLFNGVSDVWA